MFDSPRITSEEKRLFLLDDDPLVNISVGKKPNSLPPLKAAESVISDRSPITRRNQGGNAHTSGINNKNPVRGPASRMTARLTSKTTTTNHDILQADVYEHLIKRNIDANKNKLNDFDALCANLMQRREEERNVKKTRSCLNKSSSEDTTHYQLERSVNSLRRSNTFEINHSDELDLEQEGIVRPLAAPKKPAPQSPKNEQKQPVRQERPKTSYGGRRRQISTDEYVY